MSRNFIVRMLAVTFEMRVKSQLEKLDSHTKEARASAGGAGGDAEDHFVICLTTLNCRQNETN